MIRWKPIPGHENYEVSSSGRIRHSATDPCKRANKGLEIKPCLNDKKNKDNQYWIFRARHFDKGKSCVLRVHQAVAWAFLGPKPFIGACVLHKDDDKNNNDYLNLYWGTKKQNALDRAKNGRGNVTLTPEQVVQARELYFSGKYTQHEAAAILGKKPGAVRCAIIGRTFKWYAPHAAKK